jgi:prepilin-type N-terminal cleavage/methylation domain-containing protein
MKKGFSLVELAIVLVVIGIIMGMALKGGAIVEAAKVRREARKLERFEIAVAVAVQRLGPQGTVGDLKTDGMHKYLSEDIFIDNDLLTPEDYETYTHPQSNDPDDRKRIYNSRLTNNEDTVDDFDIRGDPGATLVFEAAPFLVCQLESILDDRDKVTGQGSINRLQFVGTDGISYGRDDLSNDLDSLNYSCILRWSHTYGGGNYGEYFWRLL